MNKMSRVAVLGFAMVGSVVTGCGSDEDDSKGGYSKNALADGVVSGHVKEWEVMLEADEVPAGEVTFEIENQGTIQHEFLVVKTDVDLGQIPVEDGRFSEEQESILMVDEIPEYANGTTEQLTVMLEPGVYQLVCNISGHYEAGMYTKLTVTA